MGKYRFVIVGTGWRAMYYVRIAKALPDIFELCGMLSRSEEKAKRIRDEYGISCTTSEDECLSHKPDFVVVSVAKTAGAETAMHWLDKGCTVLLETPAGIDKETLSELRKREEQGQKLVVAEQYIRYPQYSALLKLVKKGIIGEVSYLNISLAHEYHGASIMRALLGINADTGFSVYSRTYTFPTAETLTRYEEIVDGRVSGKNRTVALFEFENGKTAVYEFDSEQYRSPIRKKTYKLQGVRGEIIDNHVFYLDAKNHAAEAELEIESRVIKTDDTNPNLREFKEISRITFLGEILYEPPFGLCGLSDDETAIVMLMKETAEYSKGSGNSPYLLKEALLDSYMTIMMRESQEQGRIIFNK